MFFNQTFFDKDTEYSIITDNGINFTKFGMIINKERNKTIYKIPDTYFKPQDGPYFCIRTPNIELMWTKSSWQIYLLSMHHMSDANNASMYSSLDTP